MSECIVRMDRPTECEECPFAGVPALMPSSNPGFYRFVARCTIAPQEVDDPFFEVAKDCVAIPSWCPIIAVLPEHHGRLVDADAEIKHHLDDFEAFEAEHGKEETYGKNYSINDLWIGITEAFDTADIIVPAAEGANDGI